MSGPAAQPYALTTPAPLPDQLGERLNAHFLLISAELKLSLRKMVRVRAAVEVAPFDLRRGSELAAFEDGKAWWYSGGSADRPQGQTVLLAVAPSLVYSAIDRILGGHGTSEVPARPASPIEAKVGQAFIEALFEGLVEAMRVEPLQLATSACERVCQPLLTFLQEPDTPYVAVPIRVRVRDEEFPVLAAWSRDLILSQLRQRSTGSVNRDLDEGLRTSRVELTAELARCRLAVQEAAQLQAGDVVLFDRQPGQRVELCLKDRPKFRGRLGLSGGRYAIEVMEVLGEEPEKKATRPAHPKKSEQAKGQAAPEPASLPPGAPRQPKVSLHG